MRTSPHALRSFSEGGHCGGMCRSRSRSCHRPSCRCQPAPSVAATIPPGRNSAANVALHWEADARIAARTTQPARSFAGIAERRWLPRATNRKRRTPRRLSERSARPRLRVSAASSPSSSPIWSDRRKSPRDSVRKSGAPWWSSITAWRATSWCASRATSPRISATACSPTSAGRRHTRTMPNGRRVPDWRSSRGLRGYGFRG